MAYVIVGDEYLEIDGVPLSTPAWVVTDHAELWGTADVRGDDVLIPGAAGVLPFPRRPTVTQVDLELVVLGHVDWAGVKQWDVRYGLNRNVAHLRTNVASQPATADGTRSATLHLPAGASPATLTGSVHVLRLRFTGNGPDVAVGQLSLSIPGGMLQ